MRSPLVAPLLAAIMAFAACANNDEDVSTSTTTSTVEAPGVRLNEVQVLGSHNSYHVEPSPPLLAALAGFDRKLADSLQYTHAPIAEQLGDLGIRQLELDVFADPDGGRYQHRVGPTVAGSDGADGPAVLAEPGFKVLHIQDLDFESRCLTLVLCLEQVAAWSGDHPGHMPILVLVEAKDGAIPDPGLGFVVPLPIGAPELDALDAEIRSVLPPDRLLTPDDVRGGHDTLEEAVTTDGWPVVDDVRGRILFALDNEDEIRDAYVAGHPSLEGRVLFTSSPPGAPEAAFVKLNDPIADGARIRQLVAEGYVVRTRADADTAQARTGDTTRREAALASGAQWVSTDYPVPDDRFGTGYAVTIPGGRPARCNPVSGPKGCRPRDVEDPRTLDEP